LQGVILGTAPYMSPEQARGKAVGKQVDVWAFGCVLYEMLTGRQAFPVGETVTDTMAQILIGEPDWTALPADTPETIHRLLRRCLRKEASARLRSLGSARIEIDEVFHTPPAAAAKPRAQSRERYLAGAALLFGVATVILGVLTLTRQSPAPVVAAPAGLTERLANLFVPGPDNGPTILLHAATPQNGSRFILSPDGLKLAFMADGKLWTRRLDAAQAESIPNLQVTTFSLPFWSANSQEIGITGDGKLRKVSLTTGTVDVIGDSGEATGAWNADNVILLGTANEGPLLRIPATGGKAEPATELDESRKEKAHRFPFFLPDGRHFFYLASGGEMNAAYVGELGSKDRVPLPGIASEVQYTRNHVLFIRDGKLMAQGFDPGELHLKGDAFIVEENLFPNTRGVFSVSATGTIAYGAAPIISRETAASPNRAPVSLASGARGSPLAQVMERVTEGQLTWFDRKGNSLAAIGLSAVYAGAVLSPDEKYVAFMRGFPRDIWIMEVAGGFPTQFTTDPADDRFPTWSPDSQTIMFTSFRSGFPEIYQKSLSGNAAEAKIPQLEGPKFLLGWTRTDQYAVYRTGGLFALPLTPNAQPIQLAASFNGNFAEVSPESDWIAISRSDGVWVQSFPNPGFQQQLTTSPSGVPRWGRSELYIATPFEGVPSIVSVSVNRSALGGAVFGSPKLVFKTPDNIVPPLIGGFDVTMDERFLLLRSSADLASLRSSVQIPEPQIGTTVNAFTIVLNWRGRTR
jgi:hypothetical protein